MAVLLAHLNVPLTWPEVLKRTAREAIADNIMGMAAQLAYYFFFSLFPALLLLIAIASYFPVQTLVDEVFKSMSGFAPPEGLRIITDQIQKIRDAKPAGLLTFGVATAVWSSSSAMTAITRDPGDLRAGYRSSGRRSSTPLAAFVRSVAARSSSANEYL